MKVQEETSGDDEYIHCLVCGDGFMGYIIHMSFYLRISHIRT